MQPTVDNATKPPSFPPRRRITVGSVLFNALVGVVVAAIAVFFLVLPRPAVQRFIVDYAIQYLAKATESRIEVESVYVDIFDQIWLRNVYIEDWDCDTLLAAKQIKLDIDRLALLQRRIDIEGLSIDSATIYVGRKKEGEIMNIAYLIDRLKSGGKNSSPTTTPVATADTVAAQPDKRFEVAYSFDYVDLQHANIRYTDAPSMLVDVQLKRLNVGVRQLDFAQKHIELNKVSLEKPRISVTTKSSNKPSKPTDYSQPLHITVADWYIGAAAVSITDASLDLVKQAERPIKKGEINFNNLHINTLSLQTQQITLHNDTIKAKAAQLAAAEKSGFVLQRLQADLLVCNQLLELDNLVLETPNSYLSDYLAFKMRSLREFGDFVKRVRLDARFAPKSYLVLSDINYFAPVLQKTAILKHNFERPIYVSGHVTDRIGKLKADDLNIRISRTQLSGSLHLRGLPDLSSTNIDLKLSSFSSSSKDIRSILPSNIKLPEQLMQLGNIVASGNFNGFPKDFVAFGKFKTDLGSLQTDLRMNLKGRIPQYSGDVQATNLALGKLVKQAKLGNVSLTATVQGEGFNINDLHTFVKGNISEIVYDNEIINNISVDGEINKKLFSGKYNIADNDIQLSFEGTLDLNNASVPRYDFTANVLRLDLQKLGLMKTNATNNETLVVAGKAQLALSGNNIDNIQGTAKLSDIQLIQPKRTIAVKHLDITAQNRAGGRSLNLQSDIADANFSGSFQFLQLRNAFQNYLHTYFPYHIDARPATEQQIVAFDIVVKDITSITKLWLPDLQSVKTDTIKGYFNTYTKEARLDADVLAATYKTTQIKNWQLAANSNSERINFATQLNEVTLNAETSPTTLPPINLVGDVAHDSLHFNLAVAQDTALNRGRLAGTLYAPDRNTLKLAFDTTLIVINREKWKATTGIFTYYTHTKAFEIENVALSKQDIVVENKAETMVERIIRLSSKDDLTRLQLQNIVLSDFNYIPTIKNLGINTTISGNVEIAGLLKEQKITAQLNAQKFNFREQGIGDLQIELNKERNNPLIHITKATVDNAGSYVLQAQGTISLPTATQKQPQIDLTADLKEASLRFLEAFLKGLISKTEGKIINSKLAIKGNLSSPNFTGSLGIANGKTTVNYLQTTYYLDNQIIQFDQHDILFKDVLLKDRSSIDEKRDGKKANRAMLNGAVHLNDFKQMSIDLAMTTDNFPFLNTTAKDNTSFYGMAYGSGRISFSGLFSRLKVAVTARSNRGTTIYLPLTGDSQYTENKIYTFISRTDTLLKTEKVDFSGLTLDFDLDITPDAEIQIIFDQQAGDIMRARGSGNMQMDISTVGDFKFDMYGTYNISQGSYLFTLQNVINKHFTVVDGGTITFSGSPYNAQLNLQAKYTVDNAIRSNLFSEEEKAGLTDNELRELKRAKKTDVLLLLTSSLSNPTIGFDIKNTNNGGSRTDELFAAKIAEIIATNPNELNRQVFGLLVMNNFMPTDQFLNVNSGLTTTVSELLSNYLSSYLNEAISGLIPDSELNIGVSQYENEDVDNSQRTKVSLDFKKDINDRLAVEIGGSVDVDNQGSNTSEGALFANDIVLTYKLGKDGKYRLKMYNKFDNDVLLGNFSRQGVGFFVTQEFDSFEELFQKSQKAREKRKRKAPATPPPPLVPPPPPTTPATPATPPPSSGLPYGSKWFNII